MSSADISFRRRWVGDTEIAPTELRFNGRPLVVIDPEDREQVERLAALLAAEGAHRGRVARSAETGAIQRALREFADPKPPRPEEPGKYGVVVAGDGREWFRYTTSERAGRDWCRPGTDGETIYARWSDLEVIRVLAEGVQP